MRTTIRIDDDVLLAAKERARREGRTVGEVLSELARESLTRHDDSGKSTESFLGFEPLPPRGPAVSNELIDSLREEDLE